MPAHLRQLWRSISFSKLSPSSDNFPKPDTKADGQTRKIKEGRKKKPKHNGELQKDAQNTLSKEDNLPSVRTQSLFSPEEGRPGSLLCRRSISPGRPRPRPLGWTTARAVSISASNPVPSCSPRKRLCTKRWRISAGRGSRFSNSSRKKVERSSLSVSNLRSTCLLCSADWRRSSTTSGRSSDSLLEITSILWLWVSIVRPWCRTVLASETNTPDTVSITAFTVWSLRYVKYMADNRQIMRPQSPTTRLADEFTGPVVEDTSEENVDPMSVNCRKGVVGKERDDDVVVWLRRVKDWAGLKPLYITCLMLPNQVSWLLMCLPTTDYNLRKDTANSNISSASDVGSRVQSILPPTLYHQKSPTPIFPSIKSEERKHLNYCTLLRLLFSKREMFFKP